MPPHAQVWVVEGFGRSSSPSSILSGSVFASKMRDQLRERGTDDNGQGFGKKKKKAKELMVLVFGWWWVSNLTL